MPALSSFMPYLRQGYISMFTADPALVSIVDHLSLQETQPAPVVPRDTQPPSLVITSPGAGVITNHNITVSGTVTDTSSGVALLQEQVDGGAAQMVSVVNGTFQFSTQLALNGSADGTHTVAFVATDKAGNISSPTHYSFTLDTIPPVITITSPTAALTTDTNVTISGTVADTGSGVALLQEQLDGGAVQTVSVVNGTFQFSTQLALNGTADGSHTVAFVATDKAGNVSSPTHYSFTLDTIPPVITITSPTAPLTTHSNVTISGTVADSGSGVALLQEQLDGGAAQTVSVVNGTFQFSTQLALNGTVDGSHTVAFVATDKAGNVSSADSYTFTLDTVPPVIAITSPAANDVSNQNITVTGTVTDATSGVATLEESVDSTSGPFAPVTVTNGSFSFTTTLATDGTADGPHTVHFEATDNAGNVSPLASLPFTLNTGRTTTPPPVPTFDLAAGTADLGPETTSSNHVTLVGQAGPGDTVTLAGTSLSALVSGTGTFQVPGVTLGPGANVLTVQAENLAGKTSSSSPLTVTYTPPTSATPPNAVIVWNQATLNAIQTDGTDPLMASRALAMVQAAVYDAVNNVEGTPAYYIKIAAPADSSVDAAVDTAAHDVLVYLYPAQQATFDALLASQLALLPTRQGTKDGETVGQAVGNAIIALRANDGAKVFDDFTPGTAVGDWQPTAPSYAPALDPQGGNMTPWAMSSDSQFDPAGPPALTSQQWADAVNQVESLGALNSTTRTAAETTLAQFWNDGAGTDTPSGHWNAIAQTVAQQQGDSLVDDARLFAELDVSMADAGIATWNTKFLYDTWRPITVIRSGGEGVNPDVTADPTWTSLLTNPNFPEYVSGHSAFSMAAATVLDSFFGDNVTFTTTEPTTTLSLTYTSFDQAAQDAGMSRLYGGIHFLFSIQDGWTVGAEVAKWDLATFSVSKDTTPPKINLNNVLPSGASNTNVTITGQVTDNLSGVASLAVQIDGGAYTPLSFDATTGNFSFTSSYALNGSADGSHTINFQATNNAGIVATPVPFTFTLATKAPTLALTSPTDGGPLTAGATLTGTVTSEAAIVCLCYAFDGSPTMVPVAFSDGTFSQALDLSQLAAGSHKLVVEAQDAAGNTTTDTLNLTMAAPIPLTVTNLTPSAGSSNVSVTFRPIVTFSRPIDPTTLNSSNFYATDTTGATIPATLVPADDGMSATMFFTNPLPSASTITLVVNGSTIKAADGSLLDADADGTPGSTLTSTFTTVSTAAVPGTSISGIVADPGPDGQPGTRDDVRAGPDGILGTADDIYLNPIAAATVYILGLENEAVTSGADGSFTLTNVPSGDVKLVVDGTTATNAPSGVYYPQMVLDLTVQPGVANTVMGDMGTLQEQQAMGTAKGVYLPRLQKNILQPAGSSTSTTIALNPDAAASTLTAQQASEYSITVAPNSLVGLDGQKMPSAMVGISTVNPSLIREMLPQGVMQLATTLTIQAPGVATFTTPLHVTFANVYGAAPGSQLDVYSFNHTTGDLEITGTATVSPDGLTVTTDPRSGITHPGWFGVTPPGSQTQNNARDPMSECASSEIDGAVAAAKVGKDIPRLATPLAAGLEGLVEGAEAGAEVGTLFEGIGAIPGAIIGGITGFILEFAAAEKVAATADTAASIAADAFADSSKAVAKDLLDGTAPQFIISDAEKPLAQAFAQIATSNIPPLSYIDAWYNAIGDAGDLYKDINDIKENCGESPSGESGLGDLPGGPPSGNTPDYSSIYQDVAQDMGWGTPSATDLSNFSSFAQQFTAAQGQLPDSLEELGNAATAAADVQVLLDDPSPTSATIQQLQSALSSINNQQNVLLDYSDVSTNNVAQIQSYDQTIDDMASTPATGGEVYYDYSFGRTDLRGQSNGGQTSVFLPPNTPVQLTVFQPVTGYTGTVGFTTNSSGTTTTGGVILGPSQAPLDANGTPEDIDQVFGQSVTAQDLAFLQQGVNPFNGYPVSTGVVANLPLQGQAMAVTLTGSILTPQGQTAYVATGSYGLAIVNASNFQQPVLLGQLQLPGNSIGVAVDSQLNIAAVASTTELNLVDVSHPTDPKLLQSLNIPAEAVKIDDGIAYVANGDQVTMVDLLTGNTLDQETFSGGNVDDLSITQGALYVLASEGFASHTVYKVELNDQSLQQPAYSLAVTGHPPFGRMYLFAASGYVYVGASDNNDSQEVPGVEVIQDTGTSLTYVGPSSAIIAFNVTVNSNGLALYTGGLFSSEVGLLDLSDPTTTDKVVTTFNTPGTAEAITIGEGIGYLADGSGGLDVLNYLPFDTHGIPPTVSISLPSSAIVGTSGTTPEVVEGSTLPVLATATDDVQVRNVELLVNGQVVQNAVTFPFNLSTILPSIAQAGNTVTIQVLAYDTGGNIGASNILTLDLVSDPTPPKIVSVTPTNGSSGLEGVQSVQVTFSKALAAGTVTTANFQLQSAGTTITPTAIELRNNGTLVELSYAPLLTGPYQLVINGPAVTDNVGHALSTGNVTDSFTLTPRETLTVSNADADPATPGLQLDEAETVTGTISVDPSVSVRSVALLLNGKSISTSSTAPFEFSFVAPLLSAGASSFTLQAQVTDASGFTTETSPLVIGLLVDTTPPTIVSTGPANGGTVPAGLQTVQITFSKPIATATVSPANLQIIGAGPDGVFGDSDDISVPISSIQFLNDDTVVQLTVPALQVGLYQVQILENGITDRVGNALGTGTMTISFQVKAAAVPLLPLHFQFGAVFNANGGGYSPSQTTPFAYTDVVSTPYSSALGYGWLNTPSNYDRGASTLATPVSGAPNFQPLLEAFNYGSDNTFEVQLLGGQSYTLNVTMGDTSTNHGPVNVLFDGSTVTSFTLGNGTTTSALSSSTGQFITGSFQETVPGSGLQAVTLEFKAGGGAPDFVINALDILPNQSNVTLTQTGQSDVDAGSLDVVTVTGTGFAPNSLVTISSNAGTVTADFGANGSNVTDDSPDYAGTQVRSNSSGNITFFVQTLPGMTTGTVSARDVTGTAVGSGVINFTPVATYHFEFDNDNDPPGQPGFTGVTKSTIYGTNATPNYGWDNSQQGSNLTFTAPGNNPGGGGFNHGSTDPNNSSNTPANTPNWTANMIADGVSASGANALGSDGVFADTATFDVNVASGQTYHLTFFLGDALQATELRISMNNNGVITNFDPQSDGGLITTGNPSNGLGIGGNGEGGWYTFATSNFTANSSELQITLTGVLATGVAGKFEINGLDVIDPPPAAGTTMSAMSSAAGAGRAQLLVAPPAGQALMQTVSIADPVVAPPAGQTLSTAGSANHALFVAAPGTAPHLQDTIGVDLGSLAQVQALAAAGRVLLTPPAGTPGQSLPQLHEADRLKFLSDLTDHLTRLPTHQLDGLDANFVPAGTATVANADEIDQLFNEDWLNGLNG